MITAPAHAQDQLWLRQFGTSSADEASALASDGVGGVMVAGSTEGSLGGPNAGGPDAFLARYDSKGGQLWMIQFGTAEADLALALSPDLSGGTFLAGKTEGDLDGSNAGGFDAFLARYDSDGVRLWIHQLGTDAEDRAHALAPDGAGGVIIAGKTHGSMAAPNVNGSGDVFLARYDAEGSQIWLRQFGTKEEEKPFALATDGAGGVYVAGETDGSLGGPFGGVVDAFLVRYDQDGNQLWARQLGTSSDEAATSLAPDGAGGVLIGGFTDGSLGGPNEGNSDGFLARYDSAGNQLWIRQFGTSEIDGPQGLAPDGAGGAMMVGFTSGDLGGPLNGIADAFLAHYDTDGNRLFIRQFGSTALDFAVSVALDTTGAVMIAGVTQGDLGGPNAGQEDAFLARYGEAPCFADCDGSGDINTLDFLCFLNLFSASDPAADCDGSGSINTLDFLCFLNAFNDGCP